MTETAKHEQDTPSAFGIVCMECGEQWPCPTEQIRRGRDWLRREYEVLRAERANPPGEGQQPDSEPQGHGDGQRDELHRTYVDVLADEFEHEAWDVEQCERVASRLLAVLGRSVGRWEHRAYKETIRQRDEEIERCLADADADAKLNERDDMLSKLREWSNGQYNRAVTAEQRAEATEAKLAKLRTHVDRLDEWCRDGHASATIAGSIVADMRKTLDGEQ